MKKMKEICWLLAIVLLGLASYYLYQCKVEHISQTGNVKIQGKSKKMCTNCSDACNYCALDCAYFGEIGKIDKCIKNNCSNDCSPDTIFNY
ncbi:hypothetical protein [Candidatus Chromulinivorax destructor]|uniref:Uncharacterized protein n=1 Tax=Candidatus Chromulinivorax destructor TaxID=2066483 RepID=A0A345ZAM0_9BACT|nr:hypothetical protein [Candidatus Chromulinivorax destructor]AXK60337.1 hypothetical protein C0J27_01050 [Candidatus Chromulinivorax destructor]